MTEQAGLAATGYGMGVATGDIDNDGWVDLYVTNFGPNQMLRNRGDGTFEDITATSRTGESRWSVPASFLDVDGDGWLDLFVGNYVRFRLSDPGSCTTPTGSPEYCGPLSYTPETDRLWRNRGDSTFVDISRSSRIVEAHGAALGSVAADFDGDGRTDLYVANDLSANQLWINQGDGTFSDEGLMAGSAVNWEGDPEASMGVVAEDLDGDGDLDLFMTHLLAQTNTLYLNDGSGVFYDATRESGLGQASWSFTGFGLAPIDYDNDGLLDLFIANGAVRSIPDLVEAGDPFPLHQPNQLFRNLGEGRFEEVTQAAGSWKERSEVSRGAAVGDVDNDGDLDLLLTNNNGPARLLSNRIGDGSRWLGMRLVGTGGRDLLGARLVVSAERAPEVVRRVRTDSSYASASDARVLVGLGEAKAARHATITWPSGRRSRLIEPPTDVYLTLPATESRP